MSRVDQFSQQCLQDYADCPRRYQLRYLLMQPWPSILPSSPRAAELDVQRGAAFHHLMHQHYAGVPADRISAAASHDPVLHGWWQTHLRYPPLGLPSYDLRPEVVLSAPVAGHRLVARLDLLAVDQAGQVLIVDWKTSARKPRRDVLAQRLQTRVYLFLVARATLCSRRRSGFSAEQTEMVYWYCQLGGETERFSYSTQQYGKDEAYLAALANEIANRQDAMWPLTSRESHCAYCNYQTLCERQAGPASDADDVGDGSLEVGVDLDQVAEVAFWPAV